MTALRIQHLVFQAADRSREKMPDACTTRKRNKRVFKYTQRTIEHYRYHIPVFPTCEGSFAIIIRTVKSLMAGKVQSCFRKMPTGGPCRLLLSDPASVLKYGSRAHSDIVNRILVVDTSLFFCGTVLFSAFFILTLQV